MKKILTIGLIVLMLTTLIACSTNKTENGENQNATDKTIIRYAGGTRNLEWVVPKAEEYMKLHPDIQIEFDEVLAKDADLYTKITMMMQSPQTSPDLITEDGFMIISDAEAGYLHPLDDMISKWNDISNFDETVLSGGKGIDGIQYGIPFSTDVQGIWYSKVLLKEAGVNLPFEPKTWQEILDVAEKIKNLNKEDTIPFYIYASKTQPEQTSMRTFQTLYSGVNGSLYDFEEEKWVVDRAKVLKVLNFVDDVYNNLAVGPPLSVSSMNGVDNVLAQEYIPQHRLGIYITGSWLPQNWTETGRHPWPEALDEIGFAKIPTETGQSPNYTTMSGGWTYAIPENANQKEAAFEFLNFLLSKDNMKSINLFNSEVTPRTDVAADEEYLSAFSVNKESVEMLPYTNFRPSVQEYPSVSLLLTEIVESVAINAATPEEAADTFAKEMETLIGKDKLIVK